MKMLGVGFSLLISLPGLVSAQVHEEWVARYNCDAATSTSIAVYNSDNIYVTGSSYDSVTGWDYATVKYNSAGVEQWVVRYSGPGYNNDYAIAIAVGNSGNIYVTGVSAGVDTNYDYTNNDYTTIKYDSAGVEQWVARYNGPASNYDWPSSMAVDNSDNVYITGSSGSPGSNTNDFASVKYNSAGVEQWAARYNGPGNRDDGARAISVDDLGNVYVTGVSGDSGVEHYAFDYLTIKYNFAGVEQWVARYKDGVNNEDYATAIAVDNSGNVYVTGGNVGSDLHDYATVKYNSAGVEQWAARYNGPGDESDGAHSIVVDSSSNIYVTGASWGSGTHFDYATVKYNSAGVEQWVARYNGPGSEWDEANSIAVDDSGNVYVTGRSKGSGTNFDYATIKYNTAGVEQWVERYNGPANYDDDANAVVLDNSGNVYVTGQSCGDYATIKYSQGGSITEATKPAPAHSILEPPQPNPASGPVEIRYSLSANTKATLSIYDVTGKLVKSFNLTINQLPITSIVWDGRDNAGSLVPNGLYFIRLDTKDCSATEKVVLIK